MKPVRLVTKSRRAVASPTAVTTPVGRALVDDAADQRAVGDLETALVAEAVASRLEVFECDARRQRHPVLIANRKVDLPDEFDLSETDLAKGAAVDRRDDRPRRHGAGSSGRLDRAESEDQALALVARRRGAPCFTELFVMTVVLVGIVPFARRGSRRTARN